MGGPSSTRIAVACRECGPSCGAGLRLAGHVPHGPIPATAAPPLHLRVQSTARAADDDGCASRVRGCDRRRAAAHRCHRHDGRFAPQNPGGAAVLHAGGTCPVRHGLVAVAMEPQCERGRGRIDDGPHCVVDRPHEARDPLGARCLAGPGPLSSRRDHIAPATLQAPWPKGRCSVTMRRSFSRATSPPSFVRCSPRAKSCCSRALSPSTTIGYYGRFKTLGTFYWENGAGLEAAASIWSARSDEEAARLLRAHGVTHIALIRGRGIHLAVLRAPASADVEERLRREFRRPCPRRRAPCPRGCMRLTTYPHRTSRRTDSARRSSRSTAQRWPRLRNARCAGYNCGPS